VYDELRTLGYKGPIGLECSPANGEETAVKRLKNNQYK
jgi:hydroxypyruvate isomerase